MAEEHRVKQICDVVEYVGAVQLPAAAKTWARPRFKYTYCYVCQSHKL